ncbi:hypothetical protein L218DRAFT_1076912 [Marasmius fiardii PR-910]|nr:hypothetical protein L218DRAFT_1076912 [Marasmius fiardii PR-910]
MQHNQPVLCERCQRPIDVDSMTTLQQVDSRFLKADCTLSNGDGDRMNQLSEEEKRRLRSYEDEITQIRQRLTVLEEEKRVLEDSISKRRFASDIWPRVPPELWEIIFEMVVCTSTPKNRDIDHSQHTKPGLIMPSIALSHVCPRWRSIVLNSPRLWMNIRIVLDNLPRGAHRFLRTVIKRSEGWPLDIHLSSSGSGLLDHAPAVWKALLKGCSRWKALTLDLLDPGKLFGSVLSVPGISFSKLISFKSSDRPELWDEDDWFWKVLERAPELRTVETASLYPTYSLPYAQLTTLVIQPFLGDDEDESSESMDLLVDVLKLCEHLCHLTLDLGKRDDNIVFGYYPVVYIPHLRSLKILSSCSLVDSDHLQTLFTFLETPALKSFDLQCSVQNHDLWWPGSLLEMLDQSSSLTRLSLWFIDFDDPTFRSEEPLSMVLKATPNLTHLELRMCGLLPGSKRNFHADELLFSFLSELKDTPNDIPTLLPKLECLSLLRDREASCYNFILADLLEVAKSRGPRQAKLPLKTVKLQRYVGEFTSAVTVRSDVMEEVGKLEQDGVSVILEELSDLEY